MRKPRTILVPTDFSDCGNAALPIAMDWATRSGATLHLLHAIVLYDLGGPDAAPWLGDGDLLESYRRNTEKSLADLPSSPLVVQRVQRRATSASSAIVDYADEENVDLIVMATHGRRGPRRLLLGSTTEEVVRHASCPVLAVRGQQAEGTTQPSSAVATILVPIDFSAESAPAVEAAAELASQLGSQVRLLHILEEPTFPLFYETLPDLSLLDPPGLEEASKEELSKLWKQRTAGREVQATCQVERGYPSEVILAVSDAISADLIVMPTRGLGGVAHLLLGSVAEKILRGAKCPLLVLPSTVD